MKSLKAWLQDIMTSEHEQAKRKRDAEKLRAEAAERRIEKSIIEDIDEAVNGKSVTDSDSKNGWHRFWRMK